MSGYSPCFGKRKQLEHARGAREFPDHLDLLPPLTELDRSHLSAIDRKLSAVDWAWTESFSPIVDGKTSDFNISLDRQSDLVRQYIRPRSHIRRKVATLFERHLQGHFVIGVHVRGTDGYSAPARGVAIPFDRYFREIDQKFAELRGQPCRVFLATDEEYIVSLFEERYGENLIYYDSTRNVRVEEAFGTGPTGQVMPGYLTKGDDIAVRNGGDAVADYATLCQRAQLILLKALSYW